MAARRSSCRRLAEAEFEQFLDAPQAQGGLHDDGSPPSMVLAIVADAIDLPLGDEVLELGRRTTDVVQDFGFGQVVDLVTGLVDAAAVVHVVEEQEELFVEEPDLVDDLAADQEGGAGGWSTSRLSRWSKSSMK